MVHVRGDHVENRAFPAFRLGSLHCHLFQLQYVVVREHLQQLDFSQCCDWESILFIVHQDLLQRVDAARHTVSRLVDFAKSALTQLLQHLILANLAASLESSLQAPRRGPGGRGGHCSSCGGVFDGDG